MSVSSAIALVEDFLKNKITCLFGLVVNGVKKDQKDPIGCLYRTLQSDLAGFQTVHVQNRW